MINRYFFNIMVSSILLVFLATTKTMAKVSGYNLYMQNCVICHADDGSGEMPGVSDLTKSTVWKKMNDTQLLMVIKQGIQPAGSSSGMPPKGGNTNLGDEDIILIIQYMRKEFQR